MDIRGECGNHDTVSGSFLKNPFKHLTYILFRHSKAFAFRVGAVAHEEQYALTAQFRKTLQVDDIPVDGCIVHFKVPGMDDHTHRGLDCQRHRVGDGMVCMDEFHHHFPQFYFFAGHNGVQCGFIQHFMLSELIFQQAQCQQCAEYRHFQLFQYIGQCADVVFVTVSQHDASDFFYVLCQIGNIRNNQVNAQHIVLGERQATVDDDDIVAVFQYGHILPDLFQTAQSDNFQPCFGLRSSVCQKTHLLFIVLCNPFLKASMA
ncbi:uncharacterized protein BN668_01818 [Firmicutes bacterium CAG:466]|nr:uncharacterized protein BN668_01818 [Firmicutes bacterium CAG:466]